MAADYAASATLAQDATFRGRIEIALVTVARTIRQSQATDVSGSKKRALALQILNNPGGLVDATAWVVASVPAVVSGSTDATIQSVVNQLLLDLVSN